MESHLQRLQNSIAQVTRNLTPEDLARHPEGKWSVAEILEHLCRTYTSTVKGFERCLQEGHPLTATPTFKQQIAKIVTVWAGVMPNNREAPPFTRPKGMPAERVVPETEAALRAMDAIISKCEEQYGRQADLLNHHILGPLTGAQWRKFHWVHGRHHLRQIERLRQGAKL